MYQLFNTPVWFNGFDLLIEAISLVVALFIAGYSWKLYKLSKENKYSYLSLAFILVALGLFFQIFTSGVLYYGSLRDVVADVLRPATGEGLQFADLFYRAAFFLQMLTMLGAWLLIFFISQRSRERLHRYYEVSQIFLFVYLITLISIVSNFTYFVFYLTSTVILGLSVLHYYKNYLNTQNKNAALVMTSFLLILFSNIFFVFVFLFPLAYVLGEIFMLFGFLLLLYTYRRVTRK